MVSHPGSLAALNLPGEPLERMHRRSRQAIRGLGVRDRMPIRPAPASDPKGLLDLGVLIITNTITSLLSYMIR